MKVKILSRNPDEFLRETKHDIHKVPRNYDPNMHPFEAAREYTRALNAVKLDKIFAKPYIGTLDGHRESISCLSLNPKRLSVLYSGAFDGEVRVWDLAQRVCLRQIEAHDGVVRGLVFTGDHRRFVTVGDDKMIKTWNEMEDTPVRSCVSRYIVAGISHHSSKPKFALCGEVCQIWEHNRNEAIQTMKWGVDTLYHVQFNKVEHDILAACASDRSIILYDVRDRGPLRKVLLKFRSNQMAWNPMEPYIFTCASEDYNLYSFDVRQLRHPINVHMNHTNAVTCLDYAPTGKEFVSGSYDRTIRIFECGKGNSREIYHTKRMQKVTSVTWTLDNKFIINGSDEMNIRLWKAKASEKLGPLRPRERVSLEYMDALKEKYASHTKVKRIARHRQIPKHVYNAQKEQTVIKQRIKKKEANRRVHSKEGEVPYVPERSKHVLEEQQ